MYYLYLVTVSDEKQRLERVIFSYKDDAFNFADRRRRQGYIVTVEVVDHTI